jgi:hypothetical protein
MMIDRTLVYAVLVIVGVAVGLMGLGAWLF